MACMCSTAPPKHAFFLFFNFFFQFPFVETEPEPCSFVDSTRLLYWWCRTAQLFAHTQVHHTVNCVPPNSTNGVLLSLGNGFVHTQKKQRRFLFIRNNNFLNFSRDLPVTERSLTCICWNSALCLTHHRSALGSWRRFAVFLCRFIKKTDYLFFSWQRCLARPL